MSARTSDKHSERSQKWRADMFALANKLWDDGKTYREIATQLGITVASVKVKIRGRPRLQSSRGTE